MPTGLGGSVALAHRRDGTARLDPCGPASRLGAATTTETYLPRLVPHRPLARLLEQRKILCGQRQHSDHAAPAVLREEG